MKFPSEEFYEDSLQTASDQQKKPSELSLWACGANPIKFIDVVGVEKTRVVATEDSAQQSKYNTEEVKEAVSRSCLSRPIFFDLPFKAQWAQTVTFKSIQCYSGLTYIFLNF